MLKYLKQQFMTILYLNQDWRNFAYLNKGLKIELADERDSEKIKSEEFLFEGGIKDFLTEITDEEKISDDIIYMSDTYKVQEEEDVETTDAEGNVVKKHKIS